VSYKIEAVFSEAAKVATLAQYILHSSRTTQLLSALAFRLFFRNRY